MKKILWAVAAIALVACAGKTGLEKELVGNYEARLEAEIADSTSVESQALTAMLSQVKMEMDFKADGRLDMAVETGQESHAAQDIKWELRADSLVLTDSVKTQVFSIVKTEEGFRLKDGQMILVLTPKVE